MRLCKKEWEILGEICQKEHLSRNQLIEKIEDTKIPNIGLTYLTRLFMLAYLDGLVNNYKVSTKRTLEELDNRSKNILAVNK